MIDKYPIRIVFDFLKTIIYNIIYYIYPVKVNIKKSPIF